ncbi:13E12 repeat family protein, partial [Amycolatopsis iheyensis]|uniref:13E12 repeat family protein n=1 Tax=Amycolatopsis iheyensis TaxID=2945988 RepID=UPI002152DDF7
MDGNFAWQADAVALADRIGTLLGVVRTAEAELGSLLVEIEARGVLELFGYRSVPHLLAQLADIPKSAAEKLLKRARTLNSSRALDGTPIPAIAPATGTVAASGSLSNPMIDTIVETLTQIPPEHREEAEQSLLSFAEDCGHKQVAALGARIVAHLDPDGTQPEETEPATPQRELSLRRKRTGIWELTGHLDDETGTWASALLDSL